MHDQSSGCAHINDKVAQLAYLTLGAEDCCLAVLQTVFCNENIICTEHTRQKFRKCLLKSLKAAITQLYFFTSFSTVSASVVTVNLQTRRQHKCVTFNSDVVWKHRLFASFYREDWTYRLLHSEREKHSEDKMWSFCNTSLCLYLPDQTCVKKRLVLKRDVIRVCAVWEGFSLRVVATCFVKI